MSVSRSFAVCGFLLVAYAISLHFKWHNRFWPINMVSYGCPITPLLIKKSTLKHNTMKLVAQKGVFPRMLWRWDPKKNRTAAHIWLGVFTAVLLWQISTLAIASASLNYRFTSTCIREFKGCDRFCNMTCKYTRTVDANLPKKCKCVSIIMWRSLPMSVCNIP